MRKDIPGPRPGKKILIGVVTTLILIFVFGTTVFAEDGRRTIRETTTKVYEDNGDKDKSPCTKGFKDEIRCYDCHTKSSMKLREAPHDEEFEYPSALMEIIDGIGYYYLTHIMSDDVRNFFNYLDLHNIDKAIIEIHSPGGRLFDSARIVGYMRAWSARGNDVETRLYGMALSAGFSIFVSGDMGKRFVSPIAECMWHELITGEFFAIKTPADKEDEAQVLRHLQDTTNNWIVSRSKISKEVLDDTIRKKEYWVNSTEDIEYGFADGLMGG